MLRGRVFLKELHRQHLLPKTCSNLFGVGHVLLDFMAYSERNPAIPRPFSMPATIIGVVVDVQLQLLRHQMRAGIIVTAPLDTLLVTFCC